MTLTLRVPRLPTLLLTGLLLAYIASYGVLRSSAAIIHVSGTSFHTVIARPGEESLLDLLYAPLRDVETVGWYIVQP